jgi:hypothetical protein
VFSPANFSHYNETRQIIFRQLLRNAELTFYMRGNTFREIKTTAGIQVAAVIPGVEKAGADNSISSAKK